MEISEEAKAGFEKNVIFRKQISNLENNKAPYNNIIFQLNEVEGPKVQTKLNTIEDILNPE